MIASRSAGRCGRATGGCEARPGSISHEPAGGRAEPCREQLRGDADDDDQPQSVVGQFVSDVGGRQAVAKALQQLDAQERPHLDDGQDAEADLTSM